jgi:ubiquinol-cytochrome c reductase cytochrome c1 subunit
MPNRYRLLAALALGAATLLPAAGRAAEGEVELRPLNLPTAGFFGTFDRAALQRGFQVYHEVCAACHGLKFVAFRNLEALGYTEDQVKAIAATATVNDGPNDAGDMFDRPGLPFDHITGPFANEQAAAAANGGKAPPDLSLMAKAREGGERYIYSILTGYEEAPADMEIPSGGHYNSFFPGHVIAMPPPLSPDQVTFADGTPGTVAQMAQDVAQFLGWAAEPKLEERKGMGVKVILFLIVLTGLTFALKRKLWVDVPH